MKKENKNNLIVIDAQAKTLGRVASAIAVSLIGKDKVTFEKNKLSGSKVLVQNASKIKITNKKLDNLKHLRYSGYRGGLKTIPATKTVTEKGYAELIKLAVDRMLPKNKLKKAMLKNLKIEE